MTTAATLAPDSAALGYLEAHRVLGAFSGGDELAFLFGMSGTPEPFRVYLDAACARRGRAARTRTLPFGTLGQHLTTPVTEREVFLLFPWDFVPELDWRTGVPTTRVSVSAACAAADRMAALLGERNANVLFVDAPTPPVAGTDDDDAALRLHVCGAASAAGAHFVPAAAFSLRTFLSSGCPVGGQWLGHIATMAVDALLASPTSPAKVLVTDLDNTAWGGVLADVGVEGIACRPDSAGFRHYVYQTLLKRLRAEGVLLAAVTRNDSDTVRVALDSGALVLGAGDFVAVSASYHAKSSQIRDLAERLNLSLDAFVVVDDNEIERHEIAAALPGVRVLAFPARDDDLPVFLRELNSAFAQRRLTSEDAQRTELYRRRVAGAPPSAVAGADLTAFLASLDMRLTMHERSNGDRARALQLINKTNQFNANGKRWTDAELDRLLSDGGRLLTGTLTDRSGSHGEVVACLMDRDAVIHAFVMSCRVFQRRVEHAFLATVASASPPPAAIMFAETPRNEPFRAFVSDAAFTASGDVLRFDAAGWVARHRDALDLVRVSWDD